MNNEWLIENGYITSFLRLKIPIKPEFYWVKEKKYKGELKLNREKLTMIELFSGIGAQIRGTDNTGLWDCTVVNTSDIDKDAMVSYAAVHCGLTNELIDTYTEYPTREEMAQYLTDRNIGFDFKKNQPYDWFKLAKRKNNELNKYYLACVLSHNLGDISSIKSLEYADFWTYSFPCQDISVAGNQAGIVKGQTRSGLLYEVERLLETAVANNNQPKYLLLENVKNLVGKQFKTQFDEWLNRLDELGYNTYWQVVNGKDCGIPQNRERVFALSIRKDIDNLKFGFATPFDNGLRLRDMLQSKVEDTYFLSEEIQARFSLTDDTFTKSIVGTTKPEFRTIGQRDLVYQKDGVMGTLVATDYKQPKQILEDVSIVQNPHGFNKGGEFENCTTITSHSWENNNFVKQPLDQQYVDNISDKYSFAKRKAQDMLNENGNLPEMFNPYNNYEVTDFAPTQTSCCDRSASTATVLKKEPNYRIRKLTPTECWRLMGFNDEDVAKSRAVKMSDTALYKQAGNSIITNCISLIMEHLYKAQIDDTYICSDENFT